MVKLVSELGHIFYTTSSDTEKLRITSDGKVGIGTASPGSYYANDLVVSGSGEGGITIDGPTTGQSYLAFADGTSGNERYRGYIAYDHNTDILKFAAAVGERMRIDTSGRMLLGTSTVGDAAADNLVIGDSGNCGITIRSGSSNASSIYFADGTSGGAEYAGFIDYQHSTNDLRFGTNGGQTRMQIDSDGRLGLNQSSINSSRMMEITQPSSYNSGLRINSAGSAGDGAYVEFFVGIANYKIGGDHNSNNLKFRKDGTELLRLTSGGHLSLVGDDQKLLIGSNDDLQLYHDGSNSYIDDVGTGRLNIRGNTGISLRNYSNSNQFINCYTNGTVELFYNNSKKIETTSSGVSIQGSVAASGVDLQNSATSSWFQTGTNLASYAYVWAAKNSSTNVWHSGLQTDGDLYLGGNLASANNIALNGSNGSAWFTGNVGIGTNSPSQRLHVDGHLYVVDGSSGLLFEEVSGGAALWLDGADGDFSGGDYYGIIANNSAELQFGYQGSAHFKLSSSGQGIFSNQVRAGTEFTIANVSGSIQGSGGGQDWLGFKHGTTWGLTMKTAGTNPGYVGINQTYPNRALEIHHPSYITPNVMEPLIRLVCQSNSEYSGNTLSAGVGIEFTSRWTGGSQFGIGRIGARGSQSYDGGLQFDVAQNTGANQFNYVNAMTILKTGDVGIGTQLPIGFGPALHIAGSDPCLVLEDTATSVDYYGTNVGNGHVTSWFDDDAYYAIGTATGKSGSSYTERFKINSSGHVTAPMQPAFTAIGLNSHRYSNSWHNTDLYSWNYITQNGTHFDNSNGKFTAPVAGKYFFIYTSMFTNAGNTDMHNVIVHNGTIQVYSNNHSQGGSAQGHTWNDTTVQVILQLAANDYVTVRTLMNGGGTSTYLYGTSTSRYGNFSGFLIG